MAKVKYIKPESVHEGDTIRVTWQSHDAERSITGTVAHIVNAGSATIAATGQGVQLFSTVHGSRRKDGLTVTLLRESPQRHTSPEPLFTI